MTPINKLSGNVCQSCRTIISAKSGRQLLCPKCQEKALVLLKENYHTLNREGYGCRELELFIKEVDYE